MQTTKQRQKKRSLSVEGALGNYFDTFYQGQLHPSYTLFGPKACLFATSSAFVLFALLSCGSQQQPTPSVQAQVSKNVHEINKQQVLLEAKTQMSLKGLEEQKQNLDLTQLRLEQQLETEQENLKSLTRKFTNLKTALPRVEESNTTSTPPSSVTEFLLLEQRLRQLETKLKVSSQLEKREEEFAQEVLKLRGKLRQIHSFWSQSLALELKTEVLKNGVLLAQEAYELASANN